MSTAATKQGPQKVGVSALDVFLLGEARRALPAWAPPDTCWHGVSEDAQQWVERALRSWRWPWYWFGPPGCGKTCAALAVYQAAPDEIRDPETGELIRCTPVATRMDDLVKQIATCRRKGSVAVIEEKRSHQRTEEIIWSMFRRASIVVVDDVGLQRPREGSIEEAIIDKAADELQHCRALITSNIPPVGDEDEVAIADVYDDRVASRLLANGLAREWPDEGRRNNQLAIDWQED